MVGRTLKSVDFFVRVFYAKTGKQQVNKEKDGFRNRSVFLAKGLPALKLVLFYIMAQYNNISSVYPIIRGSTLLRCFNAAKPDCWSSIKEKVRKESKLIYIHLF